MTGRASAPMLAERARRSLLAGVPMNWMVRWAGRFPVFVTEAKGARFQCVDAKQESTLLGEEVHDKPSLGSN